jgi:heterodisulfide reductase subunit D
MSLERLEILRHEMKKCVRCSLCKLVPLPTIQQTRFTSACPPVDEYHFHAYSGGGMQVMALALLDGRIQVDGDLAQIVSACTTCGLCDVACKFIMAAERQEVIMALKAYVVEQGWGIPLQPETSPARTHWAEGLGLKTLPGDFGPAGSKSPVLLYAGAGADHNPQHAATARKLAQLLQRAGIDFGILAGAEPTTGIEAYWTGNRTAFEQQALLAVDRLDASGAETILALCGEDLGLLRSVYPRVCRAPRARVVHASEFLLPLIQKRKLALRQPVAQRVTYHDPCYLGRQSEPFQAWQGEERQTHGVMKYFVPPKPIRYGVNGVFDAPRQILRLIPGLHFVEMYRIREYAYCCGGGGGVPQAHPNVARSAALQRIEEARSVGAETLVTACQHCIHNLTRWQEAAALPVIDWIDLVYEAAGLG